MDDVFSKIFTIVDIDKINSKSEFDLFISNLINNPSPLREAVAYKLADICFDEYLDERSIDIILCAITDINPNVSRCICRAIKNSNILKDCLAYKIILKTDKILSEISQSDKNENSKSHKKNKILFSLYWLLEALYYCNFSKYNSEVIKILQTTITFCDYTIREKTAQLLLALDNPPVNLVNTLKNDSNFYVNFYTKFI